MPIGDVETFYSGNQWHNRIAGTSEVFGTSATRGDAVWEGRARARRDAAGHVIRGIDGEVAQRHSYEIAASDRVAARRSIGEPASIALGELVEPRRRPQ